MRHGPPLALSARERNRKDRKKTMMRSKSLLVLAIALAVPAAAAAGPGTGADKTEKADKTDKTVKTQNKPRLSDSELATLQHHHDVNLMEIKMGKLAQQRGGPEVKKYAAQLVKDHQMADKKAIQLAKARGVTLSQGATPMSEVEQAQHQKQMETMSRLETLQGESFDREFLQAMVDRHSAELGYLTVAIADATDSKLKAHLESVRPKIEKHADQARQLLSKMEGTAGDETSDRPMTDETTGETPPPEDTSGETRTPTPAQPTPAPSPKRDETTPPSPTPYNPSR
ncbi:MAG: DUF4142 domain-containing protein [Deltaproteobacteria bacterium]|nr:DUF4142 domain-containing protein [Kofleriaceae bacterium]